VLIAAKERQLIERVAPVLEQLGAGGYRLSEGLIKTIVEMAGEGENAHERTTGH
jgi:predicted nucleic acid-binding protein